MNLKKRILEIAYKHKLSHSLPTSTFIPKPKLPVEQYIPLSS